LAALISATIRASKASIELIDMPRTVS
jgi:hypothetical protein